VPAISEDTVAIGMVSGAAASSGCGKLGNSSPGMPCSVKRREAPTARIVVAAPPEVTIEI